MDNTEELGISFCSGYGGRKNRERPGNLREQVDPRMCQAYQEAKQEANWPTPAARDGKGANSVEHITGQTASDRGHMGQLPNAVLKDGLLAQDSHNTTGKSRGSLNADWVENLMNVPSGWTDIHLTPIEYTAYNGIQREVDYATNKEEIRQVVLALREEVGTEVLQRASGRIWYFLSQEILRHEMLCIIDNKEGGTEVGIIKESKQDASGEVRQVSINETFTDTPCRWGYYEQHGKELNDFVRFLSCDLALGEWKNNREQIEKNLFSLRENMPYSPWDVSGALSKVEEIQRPIDDKKMDWWVLCCVKRFIYWTRSHKTMPIRTDRLRLLGNGVVPQQAARAYRVLRARLECTRMMEVLQ